MVIGTFGGPSSYLNGPEDTMNSSGVVASFADTTVKDAFPSSCWDSECFVAHSALFRNGTLTDIGALPGTTSSQPSGINDKGTAVGQSENGKMDPLTHQPVALAVAWIHGRIHNLGTLGGTSSFAFDIDNRGEIVGFALNKIPFPASAWGNSGTEERAVIWRNGKIHDLGTLGGAAAYAFLINERGQVAGQSLTNSKINPATGMPTAAPFLWQRGRHMINLGTLGGTNGAANALNDRGQVAGNSDLIGDSTYRAFVWGKGKLRDLGTLGGASSNAFWMNNAGHIVGVADLAGSQVHHATLWRRGATVDLGTVAGDTCSTAYGINSTDQVVGTSGICHVRVVHGFLWEHGRMIDLNTLIARPASGLVVTEGVVVNNRGDIAARAVLPNGDQRAVLMVPRR
jgi:probable HAF family extracellular repeat protein